jgi:hypothetical protein
MAFTEEWEDNQATNWGDDDNGKRTKFSKVPKYYSARKDTKKRYPSKTPKSSKSKSSKSGSTHQPAHTAWQSPPPDIKPPSLQS